MPIYEKSTEGKEEVLKCMKVNVFNFDGVVIVGSNRGRVYKIDSNHFHKYAQYLSFDFNSEIGKKKKKTTTTTTFLY